MAVDDVRLPADHRKRRERGLGKEGKFLQVIEPVSIWSAAPEIALIVNEIEGNPFINVFQDPYITALA